MAGHRGSQLLGCPLTVYNVGVNLDQAAQPAAGVMADAAGPRLRVLFLPHPTYPSLFEPWGSDLLAALAGRHDVSVFDPGVPVAQQLADVDVVIDHGGSSGTREMADAAGSVRLWQILGTGVDHFDLDYWDSRGLAVANCPGTFTASALAECALMFMLMLARRFPAARAQFGAGDYYGPAGIELRDRNLLLVGFGASARELAARARAMGMTISAIDVRPIDDGEAREFGLVARGGPEALDALLGRADFVSLHLPLSSETERIIDARRIGLMRPHSYLINVARGGLVDEPALEAALRSGALAGAGLDVFTPEPPRSDSALLHLDNVIATPHIAGATHEASSGRARFAAANVDRVALGQAPLNLILAGRAVR